MLAACGGAVRVLDDATEAPPSPQADGGLDGDTSLSDVATTDAETRDAPALDGAPWNVVSPNGPCPPAGDPYWDAVFADSGLWGDAAVCGVETPGRIGWNGTLDGTLACAVLTHRVDGGVYGPMVPFCPPALCASQSFYMGVPCTVPSAVYLHDGGNVPFLDDAGHCTIPDDASIEVFCGQSGRRPTGLDAQPGRGVTPAGALLAHQAMLEAASVDAFLDLASELRAFGAPEELALACLDAAREEITHARLASSLAARFGGAPARLTRAAAPPRSLEEFAIDNAIEGLVRETFAAAVAVHQAEHADVVHRAALSRIARDELGHAELSGRMHAWALPQLDAEQRVRLAGAMKQAIEELRAEIDGDATGASDLSLRAIGYPDAATQRRMLAELGARIWSTVAS